ncbi:MAG: ATP-grasp domain-containing protein [Capsulimonadaceae bacterium]
MEMWEGGRVSRRSRYCAAYSSHPVFQPGADVGGALDRLRELIDVYCRKNTIDLIIPTGLLGTFVLTDMQNRIESARLYPVTGDVVGLNRLHNKWEFYKLLAANGIPTPVTVIAETPDQDLRGIQFPVIIKPVDGGNNEGVQRIDTASELTAVLSAVPLPLLVQEFAPGDDVDLNVLASEGEIVAWSVQAVTRSGYRFLRNDSILEQGRRIVALTGYTGVANFDTRLDPETGISRYIECNPRIWGSFAAAVDSGVDFLHLGVELALGHDLSSFEREIPVERLVPHFSSLKFLRGIVTRNPAHSYAPVTRLMGWKFLTDPVPTLLQKTSKERALRYDGDIVRELVRIRQGAVL